MEFITDPVFGLRMPVSCPGVPSEILNPKNMWSDKQKYDARATELSIAFINNFRQFEASASNEMIAALPKVVENTI
jgi:phosphoenolpyruvate carboxykinase (ATP)